MGMAIKDLNLFKERLHNFPQKYMEDFDNFWKYKLAVENTFEHLLDYKNWKETYRRLLGVLNRWQYFRGRGVYVTPDRILKEALENISDAYNQIRKYTILEFRQIPDKPLKTIWHQLGRIKETNGKTNPLGYYNVMSVCKPLMLLWGQTPAFDKKVRDGIYGLVRKVEHHKWRYETWKKVMERLQQLLMQNPELIKFLEELAAQKYGSKTIVPFGRFLDIYYWQGSL